MFRAVLKGKRRTGRAACITMAITLIGCANPSATTQPAASQPVQDVQPAPDVPDVPGARIHLVQPGDTLYNLAVRYYGTENQFRRIYYANRNRISNPNVLPVGIKLIIPPPPK